MLTNVWGGLWSVWTGLGPFLRSSLIEKCSAQKFSAEDEALVASNQTGRIHCSVMYITIENVTWPLAESMDSGFQGKYFGKCCALVRWRQFLNHCLRLTRKPGNSLLRHILPPVLPSGYLGCDDGNNQPCYIFGCRTRCRNCVCKKCRITFGDWHVLGNLCLTSKEHGYDDVNESETSFKLLNWVTFRYLV